MKIKVASRTSKLAIAQVEIIMKASGIEEYEIIKVKTKGDYQSEKGVIMFDKSNFGAVLIIWCTFFISSKHSILSLH